jgi:esterase
MELFYRKFGSGQPLIILHGLFGSCDNWNTLAKRFGKHFEVYALDQRNHGLSPHSSEWNYPVMAADLKEFIDKHQLQNPILLGHSMGGKTVMFFEQLFPQVAEKLIVVDMAPRYYPPHHQDVIAALEMVDLDTMQSRKEVEQLFGTTPLDNSTIQFLLKNLYWKEEDTIKKLAWRFNKNIIVSQIEQVGTALPEKDASLLPALFIRGQKSRYVQDKDLEDINRLFPHAVVQTIADAGHWVQAEQPDAFYDAVMKFLLPK